MTPLFMQNFMKYSKIFFSNFKWGIVRTKENVDESLKNIREKKKKKKASSPTSLRINT